MEEALEEVLPEECKSLDAYALEPSPTPRRIMLNSEDPLLSSSPRDFSHQRPLRRQNRMAPSAVSHLQQWQHDALQVREMLFISFYFSIDVFFNNNNFLIVFLGMCGRSRHSTGSIFKPKQCTCFTAEA